jgi:hypothetical protein
MDKLQTIEERLDYEHREIATSLEYLHNRMTRINELAPVLKKIGRVIRCHYTSMNMEYGTQPDGTYGSWATMTIKVDPAVLTTLRGLIGRLRVKSKAAADKDLIYVELEATEVFGLKIAYTRKANFPATSKCKIVETTRTYTSCALVCETPTK